MARKTRRTTRSLALTRSRATGRTRIDALFSAFGSTDPETKCLAALKMGRHGDAESVLALEDAISGADLELEYCARTAMELLQAKLAAQPKPELPGLDDIRQRLASPYPQERSQAIADLARTPTAQSMPLLLAALGSEADPLVLARLIRAVASLDANGQRETLIRLSRHRDITVRAAAVEALWNVSDNAVLQAILPLLKDDSAKVRGPAIVLMIRRAHPTSRALAEKVLASQKTWMRLAALFAMGGMTEPWARQALIQHIRTVSLPRLVRSLAREAISISGQPAPATVSEANTIYTDLTRHLPELGDEAAVRAALDSQDPLLRTHGLQNARRFNEAQMLPLLTRLVQYEQDPLVLATLVKALGRVGGVAQTDSIRKFLEHEDERVRANAIEALAIAQLGPELDAICKSLLVEEEAPRLQKQAAAQLFANNPQEATAHFRGMILGEDAVARQNALQIFSTIQDDRLIGVIKDALRDPRRDVYGAATTALRRVAPLWPTAKELQEQFDQGQVAGEVVDGEPVSALLYEMNSAKSSDRIRAIAKLATAKDLRVNTVLELNLSSRDPEVAHEAARVLRERHRSFTLPRLYYRLGETYANRTRAGELLVPQELADHLPRCLEPVDDGAPGDEDRLRWVGKALFDAFEEDVELESELRQLCQDVRDALEQLGQIQSPATRANLASATSANASGAVKVPAKVSQVMRRPSMIDNPTPEEVPEAPGVFAQFRGLVVAGAVCICLVVAMISGESGGEDAAEGGAMQEQSTRMLDAMGLETKPERFRERFRNRKIQLAAKIVSVGDSHSADLRSGTVLFRLKTARSSSLPAGLRIGQTCEVQGTVVDMEADGSIQVEGLLTTQKEG